MFRGHAPGPSARAREATCNGSLTASEAQLLAEVAPRLDFEPRLRLLSPRLHALQLRARLALRAAAAAAVEASPYAAALRRAAPQQLAAMREAVGAAAAQLLAEEGGAVLAEAPFRAPPVRGALLPLHRCARVAAGCGPHPPASGRFRRKSGCAQPRNGHPDPSQVKPRKSARIEPEGSTNRPRIGRSRTQNDLGETGDRLVMDPTPTPTKTPARPRIDLEPAQVDDSTPDRMVLRLRRNRP